VDAVRVVTKRIDSVERVENGRIHRSASTAIVTRAAEDRPGSAAFAMTTLTGMADTRDAASGLNVGS